MFGVGLPELIVIFVLALIIFGPEQLPQLARVLGRGMRELRRISQDIKDEIDTESEELDKAVRRSHRPVDKDDTG